MPRRPSPAPTTSKTKSVGPWPKAGAIGWESPTVPWSPTGLAWRAITFTYEKPGATAKQIAEHLGVRFVLEGFVRREGDAHYEFRAMRPFAAWANSGRASGVAITMWITWSAIFNPMSCPTCRPGLE